MSSKTHLFSLIAEGELKEVLETLTLSAEKNNQNRLHGELIGQLSSFNRNEAAKRNGIISEENYTLSWNKIKTAVVYYMEQYKEPETPELDKDMSGTIIESDNFVPLPPNRSAKVNLKEAHFNELQPYSVMGLALLVTATEKETDALHQSMEPLPDKTGLLQVKRNNATYYIGKLGNFLVANVECGTMGAGSSMGSIVTTTNAINDLEPKFVLMVGIAFGVNPGKQNIGDVLISNALIPYEIQRVSADGVVMRGPKPEAHNNLRNSFKNIRDWEYILPNGTAAQAELCDILSGEKLVDNIDFRKNLTDHFPSAKGGEMEGAGIYAACQDKEVPWILLKAICDFADGKKGVQKSEKQELAITVALSVCLHVFNKKYVFEDLGLNAFDPDMLPVNTPAGGGPQSPNLVQLLDNDEIPALFNAMNTLNIRDQFSYNRFKREYQAGLRGVDLIDWKDRMKVFLGGIN